MLALKAIVAMQRYEKTTLKPGALTVHINGEPVETLRFEGNELEPLKVEGLGRHLFAGDNTVSLRTASGYALPFTFSVDYRTEAPAPTAENALSLSTTLAADAVSLGETVRLTAEVESGYAVPVTSPLVRLGIPAGLTAQTWQLKKLVERGEIAAFETRPREVILYLDGIDAQSVATFHLDLSADVPGTFTGPASTAYLYYHDAVRDWADALAVNITP